MKCKNCGAPLKATDQVCQYCGSSPDVQPTNKEQKQQPNTFDETISKIKEGLSSVTSSVSANTQEETSKMGKGSAILLGIVSGLFLSFFGIFVGLVIFGHNKKLQSIFFTAWFLTIFLSIFSIISFNIIFTSCSVFPVDSPWIYD